MSQAIWRLRSRSLTCDHFATLHWGHDPALQLIELCGLVVGSQFFVPVLHVTGRCLRPSPQVTEHWKVTDKRTVILKIPPLHQYIGREIYQFKNMKCTFTGLNITQKYQFKVDPLMSPTTVIPHRTKVISHCNRTTVIPLTDTTMFFDVLVNAIRQRQTF